MPEPDLTLSSLVIGLTLAAVVAGAAWRLGMLSKDGWIAATMVGGLTFGLGGLEAAVLLITFFASSSLLSKAFSARKTQVAANFAKGGRRDWAQVAANGGAAIFSLVAAAANWIPAPAAWIGFAAAIATVNADTWGTEVGVLSKRKPILITTGRSVAPGTSGGISLLGSAVAFGASLLIAVIAWLFGLIDLAIVPLISLSGLLGSFIDSFLGATVQAIYFCPECKKETERHPIHSCGTQTTVHRGWPWLDNDWVNFLSSLSAALIATALFILIV